MRVIPDKVTVPLQNPRVSRPRLLRILGEGLDSCAATIVTGRAGAGKTLLAKDFVRGCGRRAAWYTVETPDGELPIFFRYLVESVGRQRPGFGREALANLAESQGFEEPDEVSVELVGLAEPVCVEESPAPHDSIPFVL